MRHILYEDGPYEGHREDFQYDLEIGHTIHVLVFDGGFTDGPSHQTYKITSPGIATHQPWEVTRYINKE